jgi:hypothetical protein
MLILGTFFLMLLLLRAPSGTPPGRQGYSMDCIFCKIISNGLPAEILFESERVISILDINPIHLGHALVIPKAHCADFLSVPGEDLHEVLRVTQIVARALVGSLRLDGLQHFFQQRTDRRTVRVPFPHARDPALRRRRHPLRAETQVILRGHDGRLRPPDPPTHPVP